MRYYKHWTSRRFWTVIGRFWTVTVKRNVIITCRSSANHSRHRWWNIRWSIVFTLWHQGVFKHIHVGDVSEWVCLWLLRVTLHALHTSTIWFFWQCFDGCRSKKWMLNEIICKKLSLSRIIRVLIMILSVVKMFSGKIKLLYISDSDSGQPYFESCYTWWRLTSPRFLAIVVPFILHPLSLLLCGGTFVLQLNSLTFPNNQ